MRADFQSNLQSKLEDSDSLTDPCPETLWAHLKTAILQSSEEVLGFSTKKNKDWFDENDKEIQQLLAKKRSAHQAHLAQPSCPVKKTAFRSACSNLQRKLRIIQNEWWTNIAEKTQLCADTGDYRGFYEALKAVPRSPHRDCPATCNILLRRGNPALRSRSQPEEDRGSPPARPPGSVLPTPHYNWRDRTEGSPTVHLPGVHHLL